MEVKDDKRYDCRQSCEAACAVFGSDADWEYIPTTVQLSGYDHHRQDIGSGRTGGHRIGRRGTLFYPWIRDWSHFGFRYRHRAAFWYEK